MERVIIMGCSGAGKSTLARAMGEKMGLPVVHLDKLFWHPGWVESSKEEIDAKIGAAMEAPRWIIDGNYNRTLPRRLELCDTVIYLDFSRFACLRGVARRIITNYGRVRPDMGTDCPERFDPEFIRWVWRFNKKHRANYHRMLADITHARVVILKNRRDVRRFLDTLPRTP